MGDTVLLVAFDPSVSRSLGLDENAITARMAAVETATYEAGFDAVHCHIPTDPDQAEKKVRECVAAAPVQVAMIGAGIRTMPENTLLFERIVNVLGEVQPGIRFCFNTSPETTIDAMRRQARPSR